MVSCQRHWFERATAVCRDCDAAFCDDCVVTVRPVGTLCRSCALVRAGVRPRGRG